MRAACLFLAAACATIEPVSVAPFRVRAGSRGGCVAERCARRGADFVEQGRELACGEWAVVEGQVVHCDCSICDGPLAWAAAHAAPPRVERPTAYRTEATLRVSLPDVACTVRLTTYRDDCWLGVELEGPRTRCAATPPMGRLLCGEEVSACGQRLRCDCLPDTPGR